MREPYLRSSINTGAFREFLPERSQRYLAAIIPRKVLFYIISRLYTAIIGEGDASHYALTYTSFYHDPYTYFLVRRRCCHAPRY